MKSPLEESWRIFLVDENSDALLLNIRDPNVCKFGLLKYQHAPTFPGQPGGLRLLQLDGSQMNAGMYVEKLLS